MKSQLKLILCGVLIAFTYEGLVPVSAQAYVYGPRHGRGIEWGGGRWVHDRRDGRLGWWWVVGSAWYFYPRPYAFVQPQTVVVQQAPPMVIQQAPIGPAPAPITVVQQPTTLPPPVSPVLYYCKATGTHYPETMTCPGGWSTATAQTPPQS